ncbi:DUF262 domain-containing protein [Vreelandella piezotolerans]|uniref:DUF262 domain-containing protein n=1 Tax=Vreelandella piezotolerans TaxID=2609667 RepID=UPI0037997D6B
MKKNLFEQLERERRKVDFDTFDISVKELVNMVLQGIINIAPAYQRMFRWPNENQSRFVESVFLGIPIPSLFTAANSNGSWELIDGVQRLSSLIRFIADDDELARMGIKDGPLKLSGMDILHDFNGKSFLDLDASMQLKFQLRPIKITTLSDKSDLKVRFDLFERLNTGGVKLTPQEIRGCVYRGRFNDFLSKLSQYESFNRCVNLSELKQRDGSREELVLKFFAYLYDRHSFDHSVIDFLNDFMVKASEQFDYREGEEIFNRVFEDLSVELPGGIKRGNRNITPINLYEAITVGAADAINRGYSVIGKNVHEWINDRELTVLTSGATNSKKRVVERIDYCYLNFSS